ncbi:MAG: flagellar motor switch protein FliN [bacterium]|jgi:flagellar motor switch protein FliN/FliY
MCAEALTQAEIDALLRGEAPAPPAESMTPENEEILQHYLVLMSEAAQEVFSTLLGEPGSLTLMEHHETPLDSVTSTVGNDIVVAEISYKGMVQGKCLMVVPVDLALQITGQMTGGGTDIEFGDLEESALSEAFQSLISSVNTQLSAQLGVEIHIDAPEVITRPEQLDTLLPHSADSPVFVKYHFQSESMEGPIYQIIPRNLLDSLTNITSDEFIQEEAETEDHQVSAGYKSPGIMSSPAQFMGAEDRFAPGAAIPDMDIGNLELILDINLDITVELGRTHRKIREVLELGPGSVVELDRLAGEPVDILVNGKLFAKGEVVVIDENFGVRITDILTIEERIETLK